MEENKLNSNECMVSDVPAGTPQLQISDTIEFVSMQSFQRDMHQYLEMIEAGNDAYHAPLCQLIDAFLSAPNKSADKDDYHNIAVDLARFSYKEMAIKILTDGLNRYPRNVDLLSDYIYYGKDCGHLDECKQKLDILLKVPMYRWTWRGFSFSVDYLIELSDQQITEEEEEKNRQLVNEIAENFVKYFPNDENSRLSMSDAHKFCGRTEQCENELKDALETLKVAPKCALRYADMLFARGDFSDALPIIRRGIHDAAQTQSGVSLGYLYYLSGLCKISNHNEEQGKMSKEEVYDIYVDFNIATRELSANESYKSVIKSQAQALVDKTGIEVPQKKYGELYDLIH